MRVIGLQFIGIPDPEQGQSPFYVVAARDRDAYDYFLDELREDIGSFARARPVLDAGSISPVSSRIDLFRSAHTTGSYTYRLSATDEVGEALFGRAVRGVSFVEEEISAGDTTIELDTGQLSPGVYYIGTETIEITNNLGNDYEVERGLYGSEPQRHEVGATVFDLTPFWLGRKVELFEWTPDGGFEVIDIQRITSSFEQVGPYMDVTTESIIVGAEQSAVNTDPANLKDRVSGVDFSEQDREFFVDIERPALSEYKLFKSSYNLQDMFVEIDTDEDNNFLDADDPAYPGYFPSIPVKTGDKFGFFIDDDSNIISTNFYNFDTQDGFSSASEAVDKILNSEESVEVPFAIWPDSLSWEAPSSFQSFVNFVVNISGLTPIKRRPAPPTFPYIDLEGETVSPFDGASLSIEVTKEDVFSYLKHPLAVTLPFLLGTSSTQVDAYNFDIYHGNWALGVRDSFDTSEEGLDRLHRLILDTIDLQIDHLIIDEASAQIWDTISGIWATYGFTLATTSDGLYTVDRIDLSTEADAAGAEVVPMEPDESIRLSDGESDKARRVEARIENLPWAERTSFSVSSFQESDAVIPSVAALTEELRIDNRTETDPDQLRNILVNRLLIQDFNMPQLRFLIDRKKINEIPGVGDYVRLEDIPLKDEWMWSFERNLRTNEAITDAGWVLKVIEKEYDPSGDSVLLNTILFNESLTRFRSPSIIVGDLDNYSPSVAAYEYSSNFNLSFPDPLYFLMDDRLFGYDQYGRKIIGDGEDIIFRTSSQATFEIGHDGADQSLLEQVDIWELAAFAESGEPENSRYWNPGGTFVLLGDIEVGRPYAYLSNEDGAFFEPIDEQPGDNYG